MNPKVQFEKNLKWHQQRTPEDVQHKPDLQLNGSKANSVKLKELFYGLQLCRFYRNEKAREEDQEATRFQIEQDRERRLKTYEKRGEKRVSRCLKT